MSGTAAITWWASFLAMLRLAAVIVPQHFRKAAWEFCRHHGFTCLIKTSLSLGSPLQVLFVFRETFARSKTTNSSSWSAEKNAHDRQIAWPELINNHVLFSD